MENFTPRTVAIAQILTESDEEYIAAPKIAAMLGISTKTVSRELDDVEKLLGQHNLKLIRKTGAGLAVEGGTKGLLSLRHAITDIKGTKIGYSPKERRKIIISRLLASDEPVKLFAIASLLSVTDGTVSGDLDKVAPWFKSHNLLLVRKPGLGVYVEGDEADVRRAAIEHIYANAESGELLTLMTGGDAGTEKENRWLLNLVDEKLIAEIKSVVRKVLSEQTDLPPKIRSLTGDAFVGLVVHLTFAVERIRRGENVGIDEKFLTELVAKEEFVAAAHIAAAVGENFGIDVPQAEIGYIAMHLLGARSAYIAAGNNKIAATNNFGLAKAANSIIRRAAALTGNKNLIGNKELLNGLVNHLGPTLSRLKMNMSIRNPLLTEMKEHYPHLMDIAEKSVTDLVKEFGELPEAEIAYIAMHLGTVSESGEAAINIIHRIAVACPSGLGTSRLLASRLRRRFEGRLKVVDIVSTLEVNDTYLKENDIEFIIATVPILNVEVPVITVGTMPSDEDIARIDAELKRQNEIFLRRGAAAFTETQQNAVSAHSPPREKLSAEGLAKNIAEITEYGAAIKALVTNFFTENENSAADIDALCRIAARKATKPERAAALAEELLAREKKADTVIAGSGAVLLHCRSDNVNELTAGVIRLKNALSYGEKINLAVVLVLPNEASPEAAKTAGHFSAQLFEQDNFFDFLRDGDAEKIKGELSNIFRKFYRDKFSEVIYD